MRGSQVLKPRADQKAIQEGINNELGGNPARGAGNWPLAGPADADPEATKFRGLQAGIAPTKLDALCLQGAVQLSKSSGDSQRRWFHGWDGRPLQATPRMGDLVADWIHFTLFGIVLPTIELKCIPFGYSATKEKRVREQESYRLQKTLNSRTHSTNLVPSTPQSHSKGWCPPDVKFLWSVAAGSLILFAPGRKDLGGFLKVGIPCSGVLFLQDASVLSALLSCFKRTSSCCSCFIVYGP